MTLADTNKSSYSVIGLMSGTSLDGLDIAYCHFTEKHGRWSFKIIQGETVEYTPAFREKLRATMQNDAVALLTFHNEYGTWLGEQVLSFIRKHRINADFVASHGHTVFHQPQLGLTLQIGSGQHLANACGLPTIADFRTNDVALGGQGAPLVPIGDHLLFPDYNFCLNLGGICNISYVEDGKRIAYDIAPANMMLSYILRNSGLPYDDGGNMARNGKIIPTLLKELDTLDFYRLPNPKSLGLEWFTTHMAPIIDQHQNAIENLLYTAVHHIGGQITKAIQEVKNSQKTQKMLVTGGGAHNHYLIETLQAKLGDSCKVEVGNSDLINFKEALIFAFMGVLRIEQKTNCLASVTGAKRDSCAGVMFLPS